MPVIAMLLATTGLWLPPYLQRRSAHQPNVDDYLYTTQSLDLAHPGSFTGLVHTFLHTGNTAPLILLLAAPGATQGVDGAVAVELPLLLLCAAGAWLLARRWLPPLQAALTGLAAAANQAVLGWALMHHFSVAASTLCLWSLAAYLWSDGFRSWGWSALTGVSIGLLLLSRSLSPVYAAALALVIGIDLARRRRLPWAQGGLAVLLALAIAGPWWLVSGGTALHYLKSAGYEPSSGFTSSGAHLSWSSISNRLRVTIFDLGTFQSVILLAAPLIMVARIRRMPGAPLVVGWLLLTLVGLATSSNVGTGFGLPLVAVGITLAAALLLAPSQPKPPGARAALLHRGGLAVASELKLRLTALGPRRALALAAGLVFTILLLVLLVQGIADNAAGTQFGWPLVVVAALLAGTVAAVRPVAAALLVAVLAVGYAAEWSGGQSESWHGPPYRTMALQATGGAHAPNIDAVHREVAQAIRGRTALLVRDDDLLNANGLAYTARVDHIPQNLFSAPYGDEQTAVEDLKYAQLLVGGTSPADYHHYQGLVDAAARRQGWTEVGVWTFACGNRIVLLQRPNLSSPPRVRPSPRGSSYDALVRADAPAVFLRLDEPCAEDVSGNEITSRYRGKPRPGTRPLIAGEPNAVDLDGKEQIVFMDSPSLRFTKAISIEAWVLPDEVPSAPGSAWQLVTKRGTAALRLQGGPRPRFVFALSRAASASNEPRAGGRARVMSRTRVAPKTIYYVVGTYDGSKVRLYVNGSLESTVAHAGPLHYGAFRAAGGIAARGRGTLPTPSFHGSLDGIAIYPRALTPAQIRAHYRLGTSGR